MIYYSELHYTLKSNCHAPRSKDLRLIPVFGPHYGEALSRLTNGLKGLDKEPQGVKGKLTTHEEWYLAVIPFKASAKAL